MQEVRKVMNQEKVIEEKKKDVWVSLCLVEAAGKIIPVYMPGNSYVMVGDMVLFDYGNESFKAVILMENDVRINDQRWGKTIETLEMVPIKAKAYASVTECEWKEDE